MGTLKGREATRHRLREAAWATLQQRGLEGTTVRAVAEAAGCAVGAVYLYYPNKTALLEDLVLGALAELGRQVAMRSNRPALEAVTGGMRAVFGAGKPAADLLLVLFRSGSTAETEFGRRVAENGARGTDHGVAGPMFAFGHGLKGGLYGKHPSLEKLDDGDLVHTTDFRSVYATAIQRCFGVKSEKVLGAKYPLLAFA